MPAPRVLQRAEPAAAFKMLRVLVAPTNDVELAALRCAARCGLPTGGYARAGDYDARVLAPRGVREVFDYDAPERTRRACRDAVLREAARGGGCPPAGARGAGAARRGGSRGGARRGRAGCDNTVYSLRARRARG